MSTASRWVCFIAIAGLTAACGSETDEERRARFQAKHKLSASQTVVMDAMLTGLNREQRHRRNEGEAACYARRVSLADRLRDVHLGYISDYGNVEKDYYGWFKARGFGNTDADTVGSAVRSSWEACRS